LHDRAIGAGNLLPAVGQRQFLQVTETAAMLPPPDTVPGTYRLQATYVDRDTGESYPIAVPAVAVEIDRAALPVPAPELDLITQLRQLSLGLPQGTTALDPVFAEIARINQYDPTQDYLEQAAIALEYRLRQEPQRRNWAYAVALARALQKRVDAAILAFDRVVQLDAQNPYAYAYLAVVNLYDFRPGAAQTALNKALSLNPDLPELQVLRSAAALMQGNLVEAIGAIDRFEKGVNIRRRDP
jgi:tetratricopeptide (TPR) repeat protein